MKKLDDLLYQITLYIAMLQNVRKQVHHHQLSVSLD